MSSSTCLSWSSCGGVSQCLWVCSTCQNESAGDDFAAGAGAQVAVNLDIDGVLGAAHRAVPEEKIDARPGDGSGTRTAPPRRPRATEPGRATPSIGRILGGSGDQRFAFGRGVARPIPWGRFVVGSTRPVNDVTRFQKPKKVSGSFKNREVSPTNRVALAPSVMSADPVDEVAAERPVRLKITRAGEVMDRVPRPAIGPVRARGNRGSTESFPVVSWVRRESEGQK